MLEVFLPVYNEAHVLRSSVEKLHSFLTRRLRHDWSITVVNNGSTDDTAQRARRLSGEFPRVRLLDLPTPGRGRALKKAWSGSRAEAVCYMDIDLSTGLEAVTQLADALLSGRYDVAVGSRLLPQSRVRRSPGRELLSRGLNSLIPLVLGSSMSDVQCGFKGATRDAVQRLVPMIESDRWFFDTELLLLAEDAGMRILEIPVTWEEDPDSRVNIGGAVQEQLIEIWRMWHTLRRPRLVQQIKRLIHK